MRSKPVEVTLDPVDNQRLARLCGALDENLRQIESASGRRIEATRSVDPDLIGGFILQAGTFRVDASVRGRLDRLRHQLVRR